MNEENYFRRGFGLKSEIEPVLAADYHSGIIESFRTSGYTLKAGPLTIRLAKEFGFCYGVDRAVEYAYEARSKFPDRNLVLVGEIIHNPHVNRKLKALGVQFLHRGADGGFDFATVRPVDVVIIPAFGVTMADFTKLRAIGATLVDTTCGSVLNVWKRVESYARDGFTAIIHGKYKHEETRATASQVNRHPGGRYLVVFDMDEARLVCDFIERGGDSSPLRERFKEATSPGFAFDRDLVRVGIANQTTMLSSESLAIAEEFRRSMVRRYGADVEAEHVRTFDTICSATQERQDAMVALLEEPLDVMVVVGGYNSSNTCHLAALAHRRGMPTYHIEDSDCIDVDAGTILFQPVGEKSQVIARNWLHGATRVGLTAGASTPNNKIGETAARIAASAGADPQALLS